MNILVIGASGLVGSHCLDYFTEKQVPVLGTHLNFKTDNTVFFDPLNKNGFDFLDENKFLPDVIIHCGALTNVDYCEENIDKSYALTIQSTKVIVEYCKAKNIKLVYISTDYIFDGANGPYTENETPNPVNVYGKHKLEAEILVQELNNHIIARITNVYGEEKRSKNFIAHLLTLISSKTDKTFNLPYDQFATPIYAGDIARMLYLLIFDKKEGIYNLSSTDYYNRFQLANKVKSYFSESDHLNLNAISTKSLAQ
ncbi:MAG: SDR family oxidoreductase [Flavobacterium sp.]